MKMIDLSVRRQEITDVATEMFQKFINLPKDVRPDDKERSGIQVLVWQPGTRNLVLTSVKEPSEAARFFAIEKAVRSATLGDCSSGDSEDLDRMMFAGSISLYMNQIPGFEKCGYDEMLIVSTSGLKADEDVAISVVVLAKLTGLDVKEVCELVFEVNDGECPEWYLPRGKDKGYFQFLYT